MNHLSYRARTGQQNPPPIPTPASEPLTLTNFTRALGRITPTLIVIGIATGAAFAIGGGLVDRFVFGRRRK